MGFVKPTFYQITIGNETTPTIALPAVAADQALESFTLPTFTDRLEAAYLTIRIRVFRELSGANNALDGDQYIQVQNAAAAGYINAILLPDNTMWTNGNNYREGTTVVGNIDVKSKCVSGGTLDAKWASAKVDGATLTIYDVQLWLTLVFSR